MMLFTYSVALWDGGIFGIPLHLGLFTYSVSIAGEEFFIPIFLLDFWPRSYGFRMRFGCWALQLPVCDGNGMVFVDDNHFGPAVQFPDVVGVNYSRILQDWC